jgi:hypothetical protein
MTQNENPNGSARQDGGLLPPGGATDLNVHPALPSSASGAAASTLAGAGPTGHLVLVVGDRFTAVADSASIFTKVGLLDCLALGERHISHVVVGQGVGPRALREIQNAAKRHAADFRSGQPVAVREQVSRRLAPHEVHKRRPENVLITRPEQLDSHTFFSHLAIDDDADDIADHVTGVHVPGMAIVEAARQACLAVTAHLAGVSGYEHHTSTYTLNAVEVAFSKFLYPSEVRIEIKAPPWPAVRPDGGMHQGRLEITFTQYDLVAAKVSIESTRHPASLLARLEHLGARQHQTRLLRSAPGAVKPMPEQLPGLRSQAAHNKANTFEI